MEKILYSIVEEKLKKFCNYLENDIRLFKYRSRKRWDNIKQLRDDIRQLKDDKRQLEDDRLRFSDDIQQLKDDIRQIKDDRRQLKDDRRQIEDYGKFYRLKKWFEYAYQMDLIYLKMDWKRLSKFFIFSIHLVDEVCGFIYIFVARCFLLLIASVEIFLLFLIVLLGFILEMHNEDVINNLGQSINSLSGEVESLTCEMDNLSGKIKSLTDKMGNLSEKVDGIKINCPTPVINCKDLHDINREIKCLDDKIKEHNRESKEWQECVTRELKENPQELPNCNYEVKDADCLCRMPPN